MPLPNPAMSFSPFAILTAEEMNNLVENDQALADGSGFNTGAIPNSALQPSAQPQLINAETMFDHVASGLVLSGNSYGSTLVASLTAGVVYIGGIRVPVAAVANRTYTASRDTYVDVGVDGVVDFNPVTNNAASPSLAANHIRIGIVVTGASNIANVGSINQGEESKVLPIASSVPYSVTDSLGNLICSRDPNRKLLGYRQRPSNFGSSGTNTAIPELVVPVIIPTGRKVKVTLYSFKMSNTGSPSNTRATAWEGAIGGTQVAQAEFTSGGNNYGGTALGERVYTPVTPGSKTYNAAISNVGGGTGNMEANAGAPMFLRIELE